MKNALKWIKSVSNYIKKSRFKSWNDPKLVKKLNKHIASNSLRYRYEHKCNIVCSLDKIDVQKSKHKTQVILYINLFLKDDHKCCIQSALALEHDFHSISGSPKKQLQDIWDLSVKNLFIPTYFLELLFPYADGSVVDEQVLVSAIRIWKSFWSMWDWNSLNRLALVLLESELMLWGNALIHYLENSSKMYKQNFEWIKTSLGLKARYEDEEGIVYGASYAPKILIAVQTTDDHVYFLPNEHNIYKRAILFFKLAE